MRLYEKLRAQILTDASYAWSGTTYYSMLLREDLPSAARVTAESALTIGNGSYSTTTKYFMLTRKYANTTVLNGVSRGSLQVRFTNDIGNATVYVYAIVSVVTISSGGVETSLGAFTTGTWSKTASAAFDESFDLPFWIDTDGEIASDERCFLKIVYYCKYTVITGTLNAYAETALNVDDTFVEIPLVPGVDM